MKLNTPAGVIEIKHIGRIQAEWSAPGLWRLTFLPPPGLRLFRTKPEGWTGRARFAGIATAEVRRLALDVPGLIRCADHPRADEGPLYKALAIIDEERTKIARRAAPTFPFAPGIAWR